MLYTGPETEHWAYLGASNNAQRSRKQYSSDAHLLLSYGQLLSNLVRIPGADPDRTTLGDANLQQRRQCKL